MQMTKDVYSNTPCGNMTAEEWYLICKIERDEEHARAVEGHSGIQREVSDKQFGTGKIVLPKQSWSDH